MHPLTLPVPASPQIAKTAAPPAAKPVPPSQPKTAPPRFTTRREAGRELAGLLRRYSHCARTLVLAMPGGPVETGREIAATLGLDFDVLLVSPITTPKCRDGALGAVTTGGVRMLNYALIDRLHLSDSELRAAILRQSLRTSRRERLYRGNRPSLELADQTVILADDGSSTCDTLLTAIRLLRRQHVDRIVIATPAACHHAASDLRMEADEVITLIETAVPVRVDHWFHHYPPPSPSRLRHWIHAQPR